MTKLKIATLAIAGVAVAGALGLHAATASAATSTSGSLAAKIAQAFGLDQAKVQTVIDQYHQQQESGAQTRYQDMLGRAVTNGKLTSAQEQAILAEHNKLKGELDAAMGQTGSERMQTFKSVHAEAAEWAKANNVPLRFLEGMRPMRGMGPRGDRDDAAAPSTSPSPSPSVTPSASISPSA